jgi:hypothetical protein
MPGTQDNQRSRRIAARLAPALALATAALVSSPRPAAADTMDPALSRLVVEPACRSIGTGGGLYYNPAYHPSKTSGLPPFCQAKDGDFSKLVAQYGFAIAPSASHSSRSTGFGGFELAFAADYTSIDNKADYWKQGTQGLQDPSSKRFSDANPTPASLLQLYQMKISKGFPFGIQLSGDFGWLSNTSIFTIGADVRMSILEGFRTGIPAIFPEISVGGSVRTIAGTSEMQLTVAGFDAQLSKPIPIAGSAILTPYIGYQWIRIFGDSGLIDFTPNTDPVAACGFTGTNTPAATKPSGPYADGSPICSHGSGDDFNNTGVFNPVRLTRHRLDFGLQLRVQMVKLGAHFLTDLTSPEAANQGSDHMVDPTTKAKLSSSSTAAGENEFLGVGKQWTLGFDIGTVF